MFVALLTGGLVSSLGTGIFVRRVVGRKLIERTGWWGVTLYTVSSLAVVAVGFLWLVNTIRENPESVSIPESPFFFILMGLVVGFPFSIPAVLSVWNELRPGKVEARRKKSHVASREDRLKFAQDLALQILEFSDKSRNVRGTLGGDKGRILLFEGELSRNEGDKLVAALREEMKDLGFERVEGDGWWSRI
jgi:hypothetical protein